jgi:chromate transporter
MALIGDDTPTPAHARFSWHRLGLVAAGGAGLGLAAWLSLAASSGADGPLARMGWFFTKAALLTFGGAYAVLPYLYQGGVDAFHWLTPAQMMDGLALGETTPGPLIIIVSFIGFVGAWNTAPFGPQLAAAGFAGALVATFFTFLPSFLFVLAGGPLVEASRGDLRLTAPLRAIGAAVVGLIASLALFFGRQILFPADHWDGCATAIAILASVALLRYQAGTIKCIFACAGIGLVVSYLP